MKSVLINTLHGVAFRDCRANIINLSELQIKFVVLVMMVGVMVVVVTVVMVKEGPLYCSCGQLPNSLPFSMEEL
jgi:hypothetical protein